MKSSINLHIDKMPGIARCLAVLFWIAIWYFGSILVDNPLILPSPADTVKALLEMLKGQAFYLSLGVTLGRVFGGIVISAAAGLLFGILSGLNRLAYTLILPFVTVVRTLPVVSVSILLNLWLKSSVVPLMVTFLVCFPIIWTNTVEGIDNTDQKLLEMAALYRVSFYKKLRFIYLPSLRPYMTAGMMSVIGMGWRSTVTSEVLANALPSIGMNLYYTKVYLETKQLFAWTLVVVLCSFLIERFTIALLKKQKEGVKG